MNEWLHRERLVSEHGVPLGAAEFLAACVKLSESAVGYAYSAVAFTWFRREADQWLTVAGDPIDAERGFALRVFDGVHDFRWRAGTDASRVATAATSVSEPAASDLEALDSVGSIELLPGTIIPGESPAPGWSFVGDNRTGRFVVPFADSGHSGGVVGLRSVEYVSTDVHGNVAVVEKRLVALESVLQKGKTA